MLLRMFANAVSDMMKNITSARVRMVGHSHFRDISIMV